MSETRAFGPPPEGLAARAPTRAVCDRALAAKKCVEALLQSLLHLQQYPKRNRGRRCWRSCIPSSHQRALLPAERQLPHRRLCARRGRRSASSRAAFFRAMLAGQKRGRPDAEPSADGRHLAAEVRATLGAQARRRAWCGPDFTARACRCVSRRRGPRPRRLPGPASSCPAAGPPARLWEWSLSSCGSSQ